MVVGIVKYISMCEYGGLFYLLGSNINRWVVFYYGNEDIKLVECLYMEYCIFFGYFRLVSVFRCNIIFFFVFLDCDLYFIGG